MAQPPDGAEPPELDLRVLEAPEQLQVKLTPPQGINLHADAQGALTDAVARYGNEILVEADRTRADRARGKPVKHIEAADIAAGVASVAAAHRQRYGIWGLARDLALGFGFGTFGAAVSAPWKSDLQIYTGLATIVFLVLFILFSRQR
jgi:hypothetical protein